MTEKHENKLTEVKGAARALYKEFKTETEELQRLDREKIPSLKPLIENPDYDGNGNGNGSVPKLVPAPSFYQIEPSLLLLQEKRILIADEMSLGKTLEDVVADMVLENKTGEHFQHVKIVPHGMKDKWGRKFREYIEDDRIGKIVVLNTYSDEELRGLEEADRIVVSYEALSFNESGTSKRRLKKIKDILVRSGRRKKVTLDEGQNAKNPGAEAYRSRNVMDVANSAEYLSILSGTPIPNTLRDTYVLISLLMPNEFPTPRAVREAYGRDPGLIRSVLRSKSIRRLVDDILDLPPVREDFVAIKLNPDQEKLYRIILENDELEGTRKLQLLRKALMDPALINPEMMDADQRHLVLAPSSVYEFFDGVVADVVPKGEKIVLFSPDFRKGVTEKLEQRYAQYDSARMDGTNRNKREEIRLKFQKGDVNVLVSTSVSEEGINLNRGNHVGFLLEDYAPGKRGQKIARERRWGQKKEVVVHTPIVEGTVAQGVRELIQVKEQAIDFILDKGKKLTVDQRRAMSDDPTRASSLFKYMYTPEQQAAIYVNRMNIRMARSGDEKAVLNWAKKAGRKYAENYCSHWDTSYQANVARLYGQIIEGLQGDFD